MHRRLSFLLLAVCCVASATAVPEWATETALKNFTRRHAALCALDCIDGLKKVYSRKWVYIIDSEDGGKDGGVDTKEIESGKECFLSPKEQLMTAFVKSAKQIMTDCNNNSKEEKAAGKSPLIDYDDMIKSTRNCLKDKYRLDMFKTYICERCYTKFFKVVDEDDSSGSSTSGARRKRSNGRKLLNGPAPRKNCRVTLGEKIKMRTPNGQFVSTFADLASAIDAGCEHIMVKSTSGWLFKE